MEPAKNGTEFKYKDKIYANYFLNITENINITIKIKKNDDGSSNDNDGDGLSKGIIALIIIGSIVLLLIIIIIIICIFKKKKVTNLEIEEKSELLNTM